MSDVSVFLRKRKDKQRQRVPSQRPGGAPSPGVNRASVAVPSGLPNGSASASTPTAGSSSSNSGNVIEFKLISTGNQNGIRHNVMRLNHIKETDPTQITSPLLMNRKQPGPRAPPIYETNEEGKITGKYVYDKDGKPVIGEDGKPTVERRAEMDMSLVGAAPGQSERRKPRKGVKEVFHQDVDVIKLRREEANPWILESGRPVENPAVPEHWVGKMLEQPNMPSVLLINDGTMGMEFGVVPLGRTYKFEPERPFKVLDPEAAHKLFEHQSKHRIHDRWGQRVGGPLSNPAERTPRESSTQTVKQEERARRLEQQMRQANGGPIRPRVKQERFDDDYKREGRRLERGMEGGEDEELDFDENEHFQDDDDVNTFYRNEEEEEEAKLQEEQLKKEFKMANANVGDRPQIESDEEDEEDLFGDKLNVEGKKLRRMMKKRGQEDDMYGTSDSDDESDSDSVKSTEKQDKEKDAEKDKDKEQRSAPGSAERPSLSQQSSSRGPASRRGTSPGARRPPGPPTPSKAGTAPPGSGAALLAQRAAADRGASPKRSRQNSPMSGRGQSPDGGRAASPTLSVRDGSPAPSADGSRPPSQGQSQKNKSGPGKRKTTSESPGPSSAIGSPAGGGGSGPTNKRKTSPSGSVAGSETASRKKKKSSSGTPTPRPEIQPFPGMITRDEIAAWFKSKGKTVVPMSDMVQAFRKRVREAPDNQSVFLSLVNEMTTREPDKMLKIKDGIL